MRGGDKTRRRRIFVETRRRRVCTKVVFVGTGGIAGAHLAAVAKLPQARIVGLCDIRREAAEKKAAVYGARAYTDHRLMFDREKPDACFICVPPYAHPDIELAAVDRGIHLLVEKPVALDQKIAVRVAAAIRQHRIISSSGYVMRYLDTVERAQRMVRGRKIGLVYGRYFSGRPPAPWWNTKKKSGGQTVEQSTHVYDTARYLAGEVTTVYARGIVLTKGVDTEDAGVATLQFKSGAVGTITSTCLLWSYLPELDIICPGLDVQVHSLQSLKVSTAKSTREYAAKRNPYFEQDRTFIEAVRRHDSSRIRSTYEDAVRTLAVTLAVNESMRTGKVIRL